MAEFNEATQNQKVKSGWRGGPFFQNPMTNNKLQIKDGWPKEVAVKLQASTSAPAGGTKDTWFSRK